MNKYIYKHVMLLHVARSIVVRILLDTNTVNFQTCIKI